MTESSFSGKEDCSLTVQVPDESHNVLCVFHLFSVEQKNETQGLVVFLSEEGGRYMASEKQVRSSFSSSVLNKRNTG